MGWLGFKLRRTFLSARNTSVITPIQDGDLLTSKIGRSFKYENELPVYGIDTKQISARTNNIQNTINDLLWPALESVMDIEGAMHENGITAAEAHLFQFALKLRWCV